MNPLQKNKIDISAMSEQEQKAFKLYGKLPAKNHLMKMQKDRKYFDSADHYSAGSTGREIPTPQAVQHTAVPTPGPTGNLSSSPTNHVPSPSPGTGSANSHAQAQPIGIPGQAQPFQLSQHRGSVGVGISPADNENHNDIPHQGHARRLSESHRISPPGTLRDGSHPSSSFPIQHHSGIGASSPVKASSLARRLDE